VASRARPRGHSTVTAADHTPTPRSSRSLRRPRCRTEGRSRDR
jgi:hypothetical protein